MPVPKTPSRRASVAAPAAGATAPGLAAPASAPQLACAPLPWAFAAAAPQSAPAAAPLPAAAALPPAPALPLVLPAPAPALAPACVPAPAPVAAVPFAAPIPAAAHLPAGAAAAAPAAVPAGAAAVPLGELPPAAAEASAVGDLHAEVRQDRPSLKWTGRWGKWKDSGVYIWAPVVAELEVDLAAGAGSGAAGAASALEAGQAIVAQLRAGLPTGRPLKPLDNLRPGTARQPWKVALDCGQGTCKGLAPSWQRRLVCDDRVAVTWAKTHDTVGEAHVARAKEQWTRQETGGAALMLVLPSRWAFGSRGFPDGHTASLSPGSHWFQFATVFGEVADAEFVWRRPSDQAVQLLVQFRDPDSARVMYELLADRFLYNPKTAHRDDAHHVAPGVGLFSGDACELRARGSGDVPLRPPHEWPRGAQPPPLEPALVPAVLAPTPTPLPPTPRASSSSGPVFRLWRLDRARGEPASEVQVSPWRNHVVIGREAGGADLVVPSDVVSRKHAVCRLTPEGSLFIEDISTNGTLLNGERLARNRLRQVHTGDRVSFEAQAHASSPVYGVRRFEDAQSAAAARDAEEAAAAAPTPAALPAPIVRATAKKRGRIPDCPDDSPPRGGAAEAACHAGGGKRPRPAPAARAALVA